MGSTTITVRSNRPRLEAQHSYRIVDGREQSRPGDFHIVIEVYENSVVDFLQGTGSQEWLIIGDIDSVNIRETVQVAS